MLGQLNSWSPKHKISLDLKKFALDQINMCFDPNETPHYIFIPDFPQWKKNKLQGLQDSVDFYQKQLEESLEQHKNFNICLAELKEDLKNLK